MGAGFVNRLDEVVLSIGADQFTRREMVNALRCPNFAAAGRLEFALRQFSPRPKNVRELARRINLDDLFSIMGVGPTTVFVWFCVLESVGIDPDKWMKTELKIPTAYANARKR